MTVPLTLNPGHETAVDYTIAICTWNRAQALAETLEKLRHLNIPDGVSWQVLVVDNNSTDDTPAVLARYTQILPLRHVFEQRQGKSYALNRAIRQIDSRWIIWTDDDVHVPENWLAEYHTAIREFSDTQFFGGPTTAQVAGELPNWIKQDWEFLSGVYGERDLGAGSFVIDERSLPWGANFAIRTDVQKRYSYDPRLGRQGKRRLSGEENELGRQLLRDGHTGRWLPSAGVAHRVPVETLTRSYVLRYYFGLGQTVDRKQVLPLSVRLQLRLLKQTVSAWAAWVVRSFQAGGLDIQRAVAASAFSGQLVSSVTRRIAVVADRFSSRLNRSASAVKTSAASNKGTTPLHVAARSGDVDRTVSLLHDGADWRCEDRQGRAPLDLGDVNLEFLHAVRQRLRRTMPKSTRHATQCERDTRLEVLERDGIVHIANFLSENSLAKLRNEFGEFVTTLENKVANGEGRYQRYDEEEHWWADDQAFVSNNIFKYCSTLLELCCEPELRGLSNDYFGRLAHITRAVGMRYLPLDVRENDMFGWHHDMEDKRLKLMVLLTDIGPDDQTMSFVKGSHHLFHDMSMFCSNECSLSYCEAAMDQDLEICNTTGKAGDIYLFDSNAAHRGNRRPDGALRDVLFVEYCSDRSDAWGGDFGDYPADQIVQRNPQFALLAQAAKKWDLRVGRSAPSWIETLPHVGVWLPHALDSSGTTS